MAVDTGVWTIDSPVSARHMLLVYSLFAEFLDISMSQVSRQISKLERLGYIKTFLDFKGRHVAKHSISIVRQVDINVDLPPCADATPYAKMRRVYVVKDSWTVRGLI